MTYKSLLRILTVALVLMLAMGLWACSEDEAPATTGATAAATTDAPETTEETTVPTEPHIKDEIYFNIEKLLNKDLVRRKNRLTGLYTFRFMVDGEYVEVQTDRDAVVESVDRFYASILEFDKDGYVKKVKSVQSQMGGAFYDNMTATEVTADAITVQESVGSLKLSDKVVVYDLSGRTAEVGSLGEVQAGDMISAYTDADGLTQVVYVTKRVLAHDDAHSCKHCDEAVTWQIWDGTQELTTGHYRLGGNVTLEKTVELKGQDVVLCLDGHSITCLDRVFYLAEGAKVTVMDHAGFTGYYSGVISGGGISGTGVDEKELLGGTVFAEAGTELTLYGGELRTSINDKSARKIYHGGTIYSSGTVNLYDGIISGGTVIKRGGALYLAEGGTFNMTGGILRYGNAGNSGGTACFSKKCEAVNISGGKVIAGIAVSHGGGIYTEKSMVVSGGEFTGDLTDGDNAEYGGVFGTGSDIEVEFLKGVEFYGGSAIEGGNIGNRIRSTMILNEGVIIRDGYASRSGGNIVNFGHLEIKGATIINGVSVNGGGNLYTYSNGDTVTNFYSGEMTGGVGGVGGNVRLSGNPGLYEEGSILNVYGGLIADGEATTGNGGNIYITAHSQVHLYGGEIRGGTAAKLGGGICTYYTLEHDVKATLSIGGNAVVAGNNGSDIYINENTVLTFNEEALTSGAKFGISAYDPTIPFGEGAPEGAEEYLFWYDGDKTIVNDNGALSVN